jgi:hypothetical protein
MVKFGGKEPTEILNWRWDENLKNGFQEQMFRCHSWY